MLRQLVARKKILLRCESKKNILTPKKTIAPTPNFKLNGCSLTIFVISGRKYDNYRYLLLEKTTIIVFSPSFFRGRKHDNETTRWQKSATITKEGENNFLQISSDLPDYR